MTDSNINLTMGGEPVVAAEALWCVSLISSGSLHGWQ